MMNILHTEGGLHYRRWVNIFPTLILTGATQFLSGRKMAGVIWYCAMLVTMLTVFGILIHPSCPYSIVSLGPFNGVALPLLLAAMIDGLRRPIPCIHFKGWFRLVLTWLCIVPLPILIIRGVLIQPFKAPTESMAPTIQGNGTLHGGSPREPDHFFVNKTAYRFTEPARGDVVVFKSDGIKSLHQGITYVKRIVGVPGDTIRIDPPYLLVNGQRLLDPPIFQKIAQCVEGFNGFRLAPASAKAHGLLTSPSDSLTLGPDEYLVLGDNSKSSLDGRYFGPIKRKAIVGRAFYIYAPAARKKQVE